MEKLIYRKIFEHNHDVTHSVKLIDFIVSRYLVMRIKHLCCLVNAEKNTNCRHGHKKAVIFNHE